MRKKNLTRVKRRGWSVDVRWGKRRKYFTNKLFSIIRNDTIPIKTLRNCRMTHMHRHSEKLRTAMIENVYAIIWQ